jgi:hypothetical protein
MANRDEMSFGRAFADARRELGGSGKVFTWRGNRYTTDLAEEAPRRRTGPATENAPTESMRPRPRSSITENIPSARESRTRNKSFGRFSEEGTVEGEGQRARPGSRPAPTTRTQSAPARSMGTFNQDGTVQGEGQKARPGSIQRIIDEAPNATARRTATRIADEGLAKRMPLRTLINQLMESVNLRRENANPNASTSRSQAAADAARSRTEAAQEARTRRSAGMARGGMVKKGNTDRRGKGMFYDSKSPRGYK